MGEPEDILPGLTMADLGEIAEARAAVADLRDADNEAIRAACRVLIAKSPDATEREEAEELLEIMTW